MEQSHSQVANRSLAIQEIILFLCNMKVHYGIHNSPPAEPILSQINQVHSPIPCLEIHFNIILQFTPRFSKWSHSLRSHVCTFNVSHNCHTH